jgi:hypothetical protein
MIEKFLYFYRSFNFFLFVKGFGISESFNLAKKEMKQLSEIKKRFDKKKRK